MMDEGIREELQVLYQYLRELEAATQAALQELSSRLDNLRNF
jgi:hypothetical protein